MKKYIVGRFLKYKMVDSKFVMSQVQDLQLILHEIHAEDELSVSDSFQVAAIIEKVLSYWKDFINYLKYKRKEMHLENLIVRLKIEEDNRGSERKLQNQTIEFRENVVEQKFNKMKRKQYNQGLTQVLKVAYLRSLKKDVLCAINLGIVIRIIASIMIKKTSVNRLSKDVFGLNLSAVVFQVNLVGNTREWWVDTKATHHVYSERKMFSTYQLVNNGKQLFVGNSATSKVEGQGKVMLKMTLGNEFSLNDVLYVSSISKNLVSGSLLSKTGFKLVFELDKVILTKNGMYVRKEYMSNVFFKLNVMTVILNINKISSPVYMVELSDVWHGKLGHINFNIMR